MSVLGHFLLLHYHMEKYIFISMCFSNAKEPANYLHSFYSSQRLCACVLTSNTHKGFQLQVHASIPVRTACWMCVWLIHMQTIPP